MLKHIADWMVLTKTERNVILFLAITLFAGAGIRLYQSTFPSAAKFDYRESDSTFAALSAALSDDSSAVAYKELPRESAGKLNINIATKQQLLDLPGIGEIMAERIIQYRAKTGKFTAIDDLRAIKGMSKNKIEKLKSLITTQ